MSEATIPKPESEIVRSILDGADAEVARILEAARAEAEAERQRAREEVDEIRKRILGAAGEEARRFRTREMATAAVEARRMLLWAREEQVSATLAQIEAGLQTITSDPDRYRDSLAALAAEAVLGVGGARVHLKLAERDRALVDEAFAARVKAAVRSNGGGDVDLELEFDRAFTDGGCIASDPEGRIVYNNTYKRRLERERRNLRRAILREIETGHE